MLECMYRRNFLIGTGATVTTLLAGCTGEESTTVESDNGDDSDDGDNGGLVIEEHELVEDDFTTQIEGVLLNDTGDEQSYVEVRSTIYDEDDVRIDEFFANTTDLSAGERWRFEVLVTVDAEEIDRYELEASTSAF